MATVLKRIPLIRVSEFVSTFQVLSLSISSVSSEQEEVVESVIGFLVHHRSRNRWSGLRHLISSTKLTPSQVSQVVLGLRSKPHLALRFFQFTLAHPSNFSHDLSSFSTLAHVFSRSRFKHAAREVMRSALRSSDSYNYSQPAIKFFETLTQSYKVCDSAPFVFDLLIMTCLEARKMDEAREIVRKMRSCGMNPQVAACNCLISWVAKLKGCHEGYRVFKEVFGMETGMTTLKKTRCRVVRPNSTSFNALLEGCYRDGEIQLVEEIWLEMERYDCTPDKLTYSILISALCEAGRTEVETLWEDMRIKKIEPNLVCYNTAIRALSNAGDVGKAEELYTEMALKGIEATCATFEHLVRGFCRVEDADAALLLYNDMRRRKFIPESATVCSLVSILCEKKRVSEATAVKKAAMEDFPVRLSLKSYESLIKGLCWEGKVDEALKLQAEMAGKGYQPDANVYVAFIKGYRKLGNEDMAERLEKEMAELMKLQEDT